MKKNPEIYLEKNSENIKKSQTYKMFKKSQIQTWNARYRYLHTKIKVMHCLHHIFNKFKSIFKHTDNHNLQVGSLAYGGGRPLCHGHPLRP